MSGTLHVLGFPHTQTNSSYPTCAYTSRGIKFCRMMTGRNRKVILYSGDENTAPCDEHVTVVTRKQQRGWFGEHNENDLDRGGFTWEWNDPWWLEMNARIVGEIRKRGVPTDLICFSQGYSQKLVADALPEMIGAEIMVGYRGIIDWPRASPVYAAFESQSHRAMVYGEKGWDGRNGWPRRGDVVIPNQFDPKELPAGGGGGGYLLYVGRLIANKGIGEACAIADALDMKLKVAGPGAIDHGDGWVLAGDKTGVNKFEARGLEYVGVVGVEERAALMGEAEVTLVPSMYAEPFGGVAVESMMCGTPVVTTDFGAFTDTVKEGVSGYRFQTRQEAVDATEAAMDLERSGVRGWALENYSLEAVAPLYDRWFDNLDQLWLPGGYSRVREPVEAVA